MADSQTIGGYSFRVDKQQPILDGLERSKKKLINPITALPMMQQMSFTADVFPELLWLALILDQFGYRRGIEVAIPFQIALYKRSKARLWYRTSTIANLSKKRWSSIKDHEEAFKANVESALAPIAVAYPALGMNFFATEGLATDEAVERLKRCVGRFSNRFDTPGCALIGGMLYLQAIVGRMQFPRELIEGINSIVAKPGSDEAELASSMARATMLAMWPADRPVEGDWPKSFWRANRLLSPCEFSQKT